MKKTLISIAAASLIVTSAMAADKGIDITTTGQAVIYYETESTNATDGAELFGSKSGVDKSVANVGLQLNLDADLKNGFTFGSQLTYLGTAGLEKNLVVGAKQDTTQSTTSETDSQIMMTKLFVAKKIENTTVKLGRQELPMSLAPFTYTEGWSVFKNTFDAVLAVNTDIPDTTLVGAYVSQGNSVAAGSFDTMSDFEAHTTVGDVYVTGAAYMLTVQNKSLPMTTITASYYDVAKLDTNASGSGANEGASIVWIDAKIADKSLPMGLTIGLQGGTLMTETSALDDTTAFGAKVDFKPMDALTLGLAYSSVDDGDVAMRNIAPGAQASPLYTQIAKNVDAISLDADTFLVKAAYNTGDYGTVIARATQTSAGDNNQYGAKNDYTDIEFLYIIKSGGVKYLASYMIKSWEDKVSGSDDNNVVRFWARYNF
ncbi:MAG: hypothetical protein ACJAWW_001259 [Sulfurimonas sp.]|jgi:hypothetical protein